MLVYQVRSPPLCSDADILNVLDDTLKEMMVLLDYQAHAYVTAFLPVFIALLRAIGRWHSHRPRGRDSTGGWVSLRGEGEGKGCLSRLFLGLEMAKHRILQI